MAETELKPCPFCGGKAKIRHSYAPDEKGIYLGGCWIVCDGEDEDCCCELGRDGWDSMENDNGVFKTQKEAAEAWNKRA